MGTTASEIVTALEAAMKSNVGVGSITVDGETISFKSTADQIALLDYWRREAAKTSGKRKLFRGFDVGSAY